MGEDADRTSVLARLGEMLDSMGESKVTLIGDVMLDRFHHGYANNLDSTAPVPVLKIMRTEETPGAAAHIAMGLRSLGMQVSLHCCVGDDREGRTIVSKLTEHGIQTDGVHSVQDRNTLTKIRFYGSRESLLEESQILLQADRGPRDLLSDDIRKTVAEGAKSEITDSCAVVLSDYDKGVLDTETSLMLITSAKKAGLPVIADPKLTGLDRSFGADVALFENRGLNLLSRRQGTSDQSEAAASLISQYEWGSLLVLRGTEGVTLYREGEEPFHVPCMSPSAVQQIGLHDAAATALAAALGNGLSMIDAATLAAAACDCILAAEASREFVDKQTLRLWIEELSWQLRISDR
ncbi:MAG: bifunctional heptose 7-phosphate kinase/heptose 1-phosphate adenyltransferase [Candidatus Thalassarchaeum sp.]